MENMFIDADISQAKTIDTKLYNDPIFFELCKERFFVPSWQLVGEKTMVSETGSACPFTLHKNYLDEPLLLTKDTNEKIHCLSNVCTHRGNLVAYEKCKAKALVCKYHGRRFGLDGKFVSMPEFKDVKNFPTEEDDLKSLPLYEWGNLLFTSLSNKLNAEAVFGEIRARLDWFPMDKLVLNKEFRKSKLGLVLRKLFRRISHSVCTCWA